MAESIFEDKEIIPTDQELNHVLKESYQLWSNIVNYVFKNYIKPNDSWKFYSKKAGWSYLLKSDKRTLLYLIPNDGYFKIVFVFGDKAYEKIKLSSLPKDIITQVEMATKHMEGRSVKFVVQDNSCIENIKLLIEIKNNN